MILPVFDYGDMFYTYASKALLNKLQVLQNKAIRIIYKLKSRTNVTEYENSISLLPLAHRRQLHVLQFAYSLSFSAHLLEVRKPTHRTRSQADRRRQFRIFKPNKNKIINSLSFQLRQKWNNLPTQFHEMPDRHHLKNALLASSRALLCTEE